MFGVRNEKHLYCMTFLKELNDTGRNPKSSEGFFYQGIPKRGHVYLVVRIVHLT